ncbi:MAG: TetR family transcriptional regulator [Dehalococcoidales bacterium]|nr:TetR family transcriptional regulator [Dehalococcoidales bacterium]
MTITKIKENTQSAAALRKEEVMNVAARLFAAKGYHATTLDQIAEEIGVTKPALYYYVSNKEDILRTIVNRMMEPMEEVSKIGESKLSPREKLSAIIQVLVRFAADRRDTALIAFEQSNILPKRSRDALRRRQKDVETTVQQVINDGIAQGCFNDIDAKMACFAILAVSNGAYRWYKPGGNFAPDNISEQFVRLFENGYLKKNMQ